MLTNITRSWRVHALQAQIRWQSQPLAHAQRAYDLVETRYNAGGDGLLTVLEVQRSLFSAQDQLRLARLQTQVTLYGAVGGAVSGSTAGLNDGANKQGLAFKD